MKPEHPQQHLRAAWRRLRWPTDTTVEQIIVMAAGGGALGQLFGATGSYVGALLAVPLAFLPRRKRTHG